MNPAWWEAAMRVIYSTIPVNSIPPEGGPTEWAEGDDDGD